MEKLQGNPFLRHLKFFFYFDVLISERLLVMIIMYIMYNILYYRFQRLLAKRKNKLNKKY